jgi:hypothetical protein
VFSFRGKTVRLLPGSLLFLIWLIKKKNNAARLNNNSSTFDTGIGSKIRIIVV